MEVESSSAFTVGVVEGFYGRPWTLEQRERLFSRLGEWGMTSYMYAPKDDIKHRAEWRDLYTPSEAANIGRLIKSCKRNGIEFIYAISPGLDIGFSDPKELNTLKAKLDQVSSLGCGAFALLFDDIESDLSDEDKKMFGSFGHCQVYIANAIYKHLNKPKTFLFCPTEYCASRASPSVSRSPYLRALGEGLRPDIAVLWTGPKVVSHEITIQSIISVGSVLRRPPIIWDNLHANDYDQRRLFLGPYQSRPTALHRYIRGVLTNPNCEYEANYVAIRTLAMWCHTPLPAGTSSDPYDYTHNSSTPSASVGDDAPSPASEQSEDTPMTTDRSPLPPKSDEGAAEDPLCSPVKRSENRGIDGLSGCEEMSGDDLSSHSSRSSLQQNLGSECYNSKAAHHEALAEWLIEFHRPCSVNLSPVLGQSLERRDGHEVCVSSTKAELTPSQSSPKTESEPSTNESTTDDRPIASTPPQTDTSPPSSIFSPRKTSTPFSLSHLKLLADLFYLPGENGAQGLAIMEQFRWLRSHYKWYANYPRNGDAEKDTTTKDSADATEAETGKEQSAPEAKESLNGKGPADEEVPMNVEASCKDSEPVPRPDSACSDEFAVAEANLSPEEKSAQDLQRYEEWMWHAKEFHAKCDAVQAMFNSLTDIPNRPLLYDMYSYVWDVKEIVFMLDAYLSWLEKSTSAREAAEHMYDKDPEPWVTRGGLAGELARLLPEPEALNFGRTPPFESQVFTIRPFLPSDERLLYKVCLQTSNSGLDGTHLYPHFPDLIGHRYVGPYTNLSPDFAYVLEDGDGVCGYVLGALDSRFFYERYEAEWVPAITKKYSKLMSDTSKLTEAEATVWKDLTQGKPFLPTDLYDDYPSHLHIDLIPRAQGKGVGRRMMRCLLKALRAKGSRGVHLEMSATNERALKFYKKIGFTLAELTCKVPDGALVLCRSL